MIFAYALMVIGVLLVSNITSGPQAIVSGMVYGLGYGILYPCANALVLHRTPAEHKGAVAGLLAACYNTGFIGFAFFVGPLIGKVGYIEAFKLLAYLVIIVVLVFALMEKQPGIWLRRYRKHAH
jgi:MFS family permease